MEDEGGGDDDIAWLPETGATTGLRAAAAEVTAAWVLAAAAVAAAAGTATATGDATACCARRGGDVSGVTMVAMLREFDDDDSDDDSDDDDGAGAGMGDVATEVT